MNILLKGRKLRRLLPGRNESLRLARQLGDVTETPDSLSAAHSPTEVDDVDDAALGEMARKAHADRQRRTLIPGTGGLFGEPAWDILLDLFIAAREGRQVSLESACAHAGVPHENARRWVGILERRDMVVRETSPHALQREYVRLTDQAHASLIRYFRGSQ
jgi:hypothetical protein